MTTIYFIRHSKPMKHTYLKNSDSLQLQNEKKILTVDGEKLAQEVSMNSEFDEAYDLIRTALKDEDNEVQRNALIAMYNMKGRDILDEVISLPGYSEFLKEEAKSIIEEYEDEAGD